MVKFIPRLGFSPTHWAGEEGRCGTWLLGILRGRRQLCPGLSEGGHHCLRTTAGVSPAPAQQGAMQYFS